MATGDRVDGITDDLADDTGERRAGGRAEAGVSPQWEARYEGRGRFRVRRRGRWAGCLLGAVLLWLAGLVGTGVAAGLWQRLDRWLWDTMHLTAGTAAGALAVALLFWWLWHQGDRPKS